MVKLSTIVAHPKKAYKNGTYYNGITEDRTKITRLSIHSSLITPNIWLHTRYVHKNFQFKSHQNNEKSNCTLSLKI